MVWNATTPAYIEDGHISLFGDLIKRASMISVLCRYQMLARRTRKVSMGVLTANKDGFEADYGQSGLTYDIL